MSDNLNKLTYSSLFKFLGTMIPFFCVFFLTIFSFVNRKILNGIVYLFGIFITSGIIVLLAMIIRLEKKQGASMLCDLLTFPFMSNSISSRYPNPHLNTAILAYSIGYTLLAPCIDNIDNKPIAALILFLLLHFAYITLELQFKCSTGIGIFFGTLIGIIIGCVYYSIIKYNNSDLLYNSKKIDKCGYLNHPDMTCQYVIKKNRSYSPIDIDQQQLESFLVG